MKLNKTGLYTIYLLLFVFLISGSILFNGCKNNQPNVYKPTGDTIADGKLLAQKYCTKCHQIVQPDALTKDVWKFHALPAMSHYLGLSTYGIDYYKKAPDTSGISLVEWQMIVAYYNKAAPKELQPAKRPVPLLNDWAGFTLKKPEPLKNVAYTTITAVDPSTNKLYTSDVITSKLYEWDSNLKGRIVTELPSAAVDAVFTSENGNHHGVFSCIGQIIPMDFPNGRVVNVDLDSKKANTEPVLVQSDLARPVQTIAGDFNKDGLADWVILGQGNALGGVYLLKQNKDHTFTQSNISDKAGAAQGVVGDFNNDGWQDVMVLFGRGDEGVWMFLNDQKGGFTSKIILELPPAYDCNSLQLTDMNHDGKPDLVLACGYNYHNSRILKPYHGLYIYTNDGDWKFKQSYFYPVNGCTKVIAADFDGDGDTDLATVAFFSDFKNNPAENFIYFEQDKPMSFKPHAIPVGKYGRWMTIEAADLNHDGKKDIVLGNYSNGLMNEELAPFWDQHLPFIVLENHNGK
ncbi:MAG TPA: VCBS repeat-containing protein [Mucilaginibacter sp.]|nr:VCBS repeat-containing protein [Mucilaginibacter sp.]